MIPTEKIYTVQEAAALCRVHACTIRRAIHAGALEAYHPGRAFLIPVSALGKWMDSKRHSEERGA